VRPDAHHARHDEDEQHRPASRVAPNLALLGLGAVDSARGEYASAAEWLEESLALFRRRGERGRISLVLNQLGELARQRGEFQRAADYL
jgi:hypothetical protein